MSEQEARVRHQQHAPYGFPERFEDCWASPCVVFTGKKRPSKNRGLGK